MTRSPEVAFVIKRALATRHELSPGGQLIVLQGIAQLCNEGDEDFETATQAIFHLQRAEHEQLRLDQLFTK